MSDGVRERTREYIARLDRARSTLADEIEPDVAPVRGLSLEERGEWIARLCASAWAVLRSRSDFPAVVQHQEPPAPDFHDKWIALNARYRASRPGKRQ